MEKIKKETTNPVEITNKEANKLLELLSNDLEEFFVPDLLDLIEAGNLEPSSFSRLKRVVERRADSYKALKLILKKVDQRTEEKGQENNKNEHTGDLSQQKELDELKTRLRCPQESMLRRLVEPHRRLFETVQARISSIASSVQTHISRIQHQQGSNLDQVSQMNQEAAAKLAAIIQKTTKNAPKSTNFQAELIPLLSNQLYQNYHQLRDYTKNEKVDSTARALKTPSTPKAAPSLKIKKNLLNKSVLVREAPYFSTFDQNPINIQLKSIIIEVDESTQRDEIANPDPQMPPISPPCCICYSDYPDSYACKRPNSWLKVVKNGVEVYSNDSEASSLRDIVYGSGYYFIYDSSWKGILRKGEDDEDPVKWWSQQSFDLCDAGMTRLRVSRDGRTLGCRKNSYKIVLVSVNVDGSPGAVCRVINELDGVIDCFDMIGVNRVLIATKKRRIGLFGFDMVSKTSELLSWSKIESVAGVDDRCNRLYSAVSKSEDFLAVLVGNGVECSPSPRIVVFAIGEDPLRQKSTIFVKKSTKNCFQSIVFGPSFGRSEFICGYSGATSRVSVYRYDTRNESIRLQKEIFVERVIGDVWRLGRFKRVVYGLGCDERVLKVKFSSLKD